MFIPKRIYIKHECRYDQNTWDIVSRVKKYNPQVEVIELPQGRFKYPEISPRDKFLHMKESAIISNRKAPFITTFESPGDIVENLTTILNLSWMCCLNCEYCYLQTNQTPEHYLFANLRESERYIAVAPVAHAAILTIWTQISHALKKPLNKIPENLRETSDSLRKLFASANINTDSKAIDLYTLRQKWIHGLLHKNNKEYKIPFKDFFVSGETIKKWYEINRQFPFTLTASEFTDLLASDHLTVHSNFLMKMVAKYPEFRCTVRTKSAYVDEILKHDGHERVRMQMSFNTDYIIKTYEHGTASLDERLFAAKKIQEAKGFKLEIIMEPMIYYKGYKAEYKKLLQKILTTLDTSRIEKITLGSARYTTQLKQQVKMHFPKTTLFKEDQGLLSPEKKDKRWRYSKQFRISLYKSMIEEIKKYSDIRVELGSENPSIWDGLGMKKESTINRTVAQLLEPVDSQFENNMADQMKKSKPKKSTSKKIDIGEEKKILKRDLKVIAIPITPPIPIKQDIEDADESNQSLYFSAILQALDRDKFQTEASKLSELDRLFQAMIGKGGPVTEEIINEWDHVDSTPIRKVRNDDAIFKPIRIVGRVSEVSTAKPVEIMGSDKVVGVQTFSIEDPNGHSIMTLPIPVRFLKKDLSKLFDQRKVCAFHGAVVPVFGNGRSVKSEYRFFLSDIVEDVKANDLISERPSGKIRSSFSILINSKKIGIPENHPYWVTIDHKGFKERIKYIKSVLTDNLHITGLESAKELNRCIEFMILQSLSQGTNTFSEKLHSLVIGPANVGKGYLTKIALVLNPKGQEISSTGNKITPAGLVGTVKQKNKKNISTPGILPNNSGGVVCIQEFHDIIGSNRKIICGIFARMMEEGQVIDSTSADTKHIAETSLHLDQNRYSQIYKDRPFNSYSDIDIPINVLSRFDFIMEIPRNAKRQDDVSSDMIESIVELGGKKNDERENEWVNRLKMLITFLRDENKEVKYFDVKEYYKGKLDNAFNTVKKLSHNTNTLQDMQLRITRSMPKLIKAIACLDSSRVAKKEHVDYAITFIEDKLRFITGISPDDIVDDLIDVNNIAERQNIIAKEYYGKQFIIKEVREYVLSKMSGEISDKTILRDIEDIGAKSINKKKGIWSLNSDTSKKKLNSEPLVSSKSSSNIPSPSNRIITYKETTSQGLNPQSKLGQYDFPFTVNPTQGCFFGCKYCYSATMFPGSKEEKKNSFFNHIEISLDKAQLLKEELPKYAKLPQHFKRAQINETSDYYLSQVMTSLEGKNRDVMLEILDVFHEEWKRGNKWMLHILTKSPLILRHIDKLKQMKEMVQVEISFASDDETISRTLEYFTPTIKKRLELVESLSKEGIFVRIMAMPFYGDGSSLDALKNEAFKRGAKAFKNKGINYYKWEDLVAINNFEEFINSNIPDNEGRTDKKDESRIIKSGEFYQKNGTSMQVTVLMPKKEFTKGGKWAAMTKIDERFEGTVMKVIDCGYHECNNVDWGYIK